MKSVQLRNRDPLPRLGAASQPPPPGVTVSPAAMTTSAVVSISFNNILLFMVAFPLDLNNYFPSLLYGGCYLPSLLLLLLLLFSMLLFMLMVGFFSGSWILKFLIFNAISCQQFCGFSGDFYFFFYFTV